MLVTCFYWQFTDFPKKWIFLILIAFSWHLLTGVETSELKMIPYLIDIIGRFANRTFLRQRIFMINRSRCRFILALDYPGNVKSLIWLDSTGHKFCAATQLMKIKIQINIQAFLQYRCRRRLYPPTLSDKISADKTAENLTGCRKFCPPKSFVRRKLCPRKYFVRGNIKHVKLTQISC